MMKFFNQAKKYPLRTAVISEGTAYTYSELISQATAVAQYLLQGREDLKSERIAFLAPPSFCLLYTSPSPRDS